ncbi:hypothetical protein FBQ85_23790 [Cytophagia bacterium CHB2]|nr:hypothetical protein [Cytophagia bacterium CHB2]
MRERADLAEQPAAYDADIEAADNWMQKALETRKIKAERQPAATGIAMATGALQTTGTVLFDWFPWMQEIG